MSGESVYGWHFLRADNTAYVRAGSAAWDAAWDAARRAAGNTACGVSYWHGVRPHAARVRAAERAEKGEKNG